MRKKKIIVGNWKMAPLTEAEARKTFAGIKKQAMKLRNTEIIVCPPFVYVSDLAKRSAGKRFSVGAQNSFWKEEGAYTGEVSPVMIKALGVSYVILGHSERRALGESNDMVAQKMNTAIKAGLKVILCVGEKERDEHGAYTKYIEEQVRESFAGIQKKSLEHIIVAYEPVWAIGAKALRAATPGDVIEVSILLRKIFTTLYGNDAGRSLIILYGGSVDEKNCESFMNEGGADGLLVGRASLNAKQFSQILTVAEQTTKKRK